MYIYATQSDLQQKTAQRCSSKGVPIDEILGVIRHPYHTCTLHENRCGWYVTLVAVMLGCRCVTYAFLTVSVGDMPQYGKVIGPASGHEWLTSVTPRDYTCLGVYNTWGYLQDIPTHSIGCTCRYICHYRSGKSYCTSRWYAFRWYQVPP